MRRVVVPAGPARLLQVVLQGPRYVGVDHQPHVRLVYAHAEGVGGGDGPEPALDEVVLHLLLALGREPGVEVVRLCPLVPQESGDPLGVPPGGAVDDGPALEIIRKVAFQYVVEVGQLLDLTGWYDRELKVGPLRAPVNHIQNDAQGLLEIVDDLLLDVGLGGGREAQHRGQVFSVPPALDVAADVPVVGATVVSPLGQAMGLVQHQAPICLCSRAPLRDRLLSCSGEMSRMDASPSRTRSRALRLSGMDRRPLTVTQLLMPCFSRLATWSAISATRGEMTTVRLPVLSYRDSAGTW